MNNVFKALADPTRRRVLQLLRGGPMTAGEISGNFVVSQPTISAHLGVLREAGLVEAEKSGRMVIYRLKMSVLEDALLGFVEAFGMEISMLDDGAPSRRDVANGEYSR